ncbi:hypothetical protein TWF281_007912 [Arthrobotrys megalospora]
MRKYKEEREREKEEKQEAKEEKNMTKDLENAAIASRGKRNLLGGLQGGWKSSSSLELLKKSFGKKKE